MLAAKVDACQAEIVLALRKIGAQVESLASVGHGVPDLMVLFRDRIILLELKSVNGKLRKSQVEWHRRWAGHVYVVNSIEGAFRAIGAVWITGAEVQDSEI